MLRHVSTAICLVFAALPANAQNNPFGEVHQALPYAGRDITAMGIGDLGADGGVDVVVSSFGAMQVWRNDGFGVFEDVTTSHGPGVVYGVRVMSLADLDGDGDLDLLAAPSFDPLHAYRNDGSGQLIDVTAQWLGVTASAIADIACGDVDGDGDIDVYVGHGYRAADRLYLNDGAGRLQDASATHLPADAVYGTHVLLADVDVDGDLDAVVTRDVGVCLYRNDGTGHFVDVTGATLPPAPAGSTVGAADIDGDGDLDLVLGGPQCFVNDGSGRFTDQTAARLPADLPAAVEIAFADLDNDGAVDLLLGHWGDGLGVLRNDRFGMFSAVPGATPPYTPGHVRCIRAADLDGDGHVDLMLGSWWYGALALLNDGVGRFVDASVPLVGEVAGGEYFDAAVADFDGDGDPDIYCSNGHPEAYIRDTLLIQSDDGTFFDNSDVAIPNVLTAGQRVEAGDLDGDGDIDVFLADMYGSRDRVFLNDGRGVFHDATATGLAGIRGGSYVVGLCDVDADGDLDAWTSSPVRLLLNDGRGVFRVAVGHLPAVTGESLDFGFGDFDADGDTDVLWLQGGDQLVLWLNDGAGRFTTAPAGSVPSGLGFCMRFAVADLDGDGDLDVCRASRTANDAILWNDGSARFSAGAWPLPATVAYGVTAADIDGDGDMDLLVSGGEQPRVLWNDGAGGFGVSEPIVGPQPWRGEYSLVLDDLDGDGDLDLVRPSGSLHVSLNLLRHLRWLDRPRIGRPLRLELRGPARAYWLVDAALEPAWIPLPMGVLRFTPRSLVGALVGRLDGDGRAILAFDVPALPALVGVPLRWQGLFADGAALSMTNVDVTAFVGS